MGRSQISISIIKELISAKNERRRASQYEEMMNSQNNMRKELPPTFEITFIETNPKNHLTKIELLRSQNYRTIARYVTRDYVKYPILSEWKTRTRVIKKSIKLTNEVLEKLNYNEDEIISENATAIIIALYNEELFPSWFLREMYNEEYNQAKQKLNYDFNEFETKCQQSINSYRNCISKCNNDIEPLNQLLIKRNAKLDKQKNKIITIQSANKKPIKYITTFGIYSYFVSDYRKNKLEIKCRALSTSIEELKNKIAKLNVLIDKSKNNIQSLNQSIEKSRTEVNDSLIAAKKSLSEKLNTITPLPYDEKPFELPKAITKEKQNDLHINQQLIKEPVPDYIKEQQKALTYINKYEGIETDKGEHYYKLAMKYFDLQKACYRPLMIKNFEKYLISKPYVAAYQNYIVPPFSSEFITYPQCENEIELAERNFLRNIYYFLARAYQQENDTENAFKYLKLGMEIIPEGRNLFIFELFATCKKANKLPEFISYCKGLPPRHQYPELIKQAQNLIDSGYVFKPRKKSNSSNSIG